MDRDEAIKRIREGLKRRSGKTWSVTGGRGTGWGWIHIDAPPARRTWRCFLPEGAPDRPESYQQRDSGKPGGSSSPDDRAELAALLGLPVVHFQGASIAASNNHRIEYVDRAEGRPPSVLGEPYWD